MLQFSRDNNRIQCVDKYTHGIWYFPEKYTSSEGKREADQLLCPLQRTVETINDGWTVSVKGLIRRVMEGKI